MQAQIAALFQRLTQGVYVIGVVDQTRVNAFTAAWVMQVSFNPPLLALSINPHNRSHGLLRRSGVFSVNVLSATQRDLARHFGQAQTADKLATVPWHAGLDGLPLLDQALAWFECQVLASHAAGDHELVVARVVGGALADPAATPMSYADTGTMDAATALYPAEF
jgi:flavin reductase (DIM6/NTAB) family NADH-FMN oxidoreductase RutF